MTVILRQNDNNKNRFVKAKPEKEVHPDRLAGLLDGFSIHMHKYSCNKKFNYVSTIYMS